MIRKNCPAETTQDGWKEKGWIPTPGLLEHMDWSQGLAHSINSRMNKLMGQQWFSTGGHYSSLGSDWKFTESLSEGAGEQGKRCPHTTKNSIAQNENCAPTET